MRTQAAVAIAVLLSACSWSASDEKSPAPVALVSLAKAEMSAIAETVKLYGVVELNPTGERVLSAPVEAVLQTIDAPVGTRVERGQVIAHLAATPAARLELVKASSDARAADEAYARAQRLRADGLVGNAETESARSAARSADATRNSLTTRNASLVLKAPVSGYVATITPHSGELIAAGSAVAAIAQLTDVRAHLGIDPALVGRIGIGASLIIAPVMAGAPIQSQILAVSPVADAQTKLAAVFGGIPPDAGYNPGVAITGSLTLVASEGSLTIPYGALLDDGGQPFVFVAVDGVAHRHDVVTGAAGQDRVAIRAGLRPGDLVVTQGGSALEDGMKVRLQ